MHKPKRLTARLTVRVPSNILRSLTADAERNFCSVSARVLHALREAGHPLHPSKQKGSHS